MFLKQLNNKSYLFNSLRFYCQFFKRDPLDRSDNLINLLKHSSPQQALLIIKKFPPNKRKAYHYHQLMKYFPNPDQIQSFINEMNDLGINIDTKSYTMLINAYCKEGNIEKAIKIKNLMLENHIRVNQITYTILLKGLNTIKNNMEYSEQLFNEMRRRGLKRNNSIYSIMISGYANKGDLSSIYKMINYMKLDNLKPNTYTQREILSGIIKSGNLSSAREYLNNIIENETLDNCILHNTMISAYVRKLKFDDAFNLLSDMKNSNNFPDVVSYTTILSALSREGLYKKIDELLIEMKQFGIYPNCKTYELIIFNCGEKLDYINAHKYIEQMKIHNLVPSCNIYATLISSCIKNNEIELLYTFLKDLEQTNQDIPLNLYEKICYELCSLNLLDKAIDIVNKLRNSMKYKPHELIKVHNYILRGTSEKYTEIHETLKLYNNIKDKYPFDIYTYTTLINAFAKRGLYKDAENIFNNMKNKGLKPNIIAYSSLICANINGGNINNALDIQNRMIKEGIKPNEYVQTSILSGLLSYNPLLIINILNIYKTNNIRIVLPSIVLIISGLLNKELSKILIDILEFTNNIGINIPQDIFNRCIISFIKQNNIEYAKLIAKLHSNEMQHLLLKKEQTKSKLYPTLQLIQDDI